MSSPDLHGIFQVGADVIKTSTDPVTSKIVVQLGSVVGEVVDSDNAEWWQHVGFASRPSKAVAGKSSAQAFVVKRSDHDAVIASQDVRGLSIYGNLADGETCVYGPGGDGNSQGRLLCKDDGSVTLYTTDSNTSTGNPVSLRISPSNGMEFTCQWGGFRFDQTGFHLWTQAGPRIDMGGISVPGVPDAVTGAFAGYAKITAPTVALEGANTVLGMGPVFTQAVGGNSALLINGGPVPLGLSDITVQALMASNTVWVSL